MSHKTSGALRYSEVKGLHRCTADWWIDLGSEWAGQAFALLGTEQQTIAALDERGKLHALPGYLWDGSSGPTADGAADPVPSLVHDVLYEAMRTRKLSIGMRKKADALYHALLRERGMGRFRAGLRYWGLRLFAGYAASPRRGAEYPSREAA